METLYAEHKNMSKNSSLTNLFGIWEKTSDISCEFNRNKRVDH